MSPRDMSVFAGGGRVNLNLFATCIFYIVATSSVETTSRRFVFAGNSFSDLLAYKVRRVNNILIIGNPVTLILDNVYIYNDTNLIYSVNSYRIALIMRCYLILSACKMAWVWAKCKICHPVTVTR